MVDIKRTGKSKLKKRIRTIVLIVVGVVAIGGITVDRVPDVLATGARSVAVISALLKTDDIAAETRRWIDYAGSV